MVNFFNQCTLIIRIEAVLCVKYNNGAVECSPVATDPVLAFSPEVTIINPGKVNERKCRVVAHFVKPFDV